MPPGAPHHVLPLPHLPTLDDPPTWTNRDGRVDRSCLLEIRCSELWRRVPYDDWTPATSNLTHPIRPRLHVGGGDSSPPPPPAPALRRYTLTQLRARTSLIVDAHDLDALAARRHPFALRGDHRTPKARALRSLATPYLHPRTRKKLLHSPDPRDRFRVRHAHPVDPNKGAAASRTPGLPHSWRTTLTIERWQHHLLLNHHYFVCPACGGIEPKIHHGDHGGHGGGSGFNPDGITSVSSVVRSDRQSRRPYPKALPEGRVKKLFLVLATPAELSDAHLAFRWLQQFNPASPQFNRHLANSPATALECKLITRYAPLFPPRRPLCRDCLGVRYGEVKRRPS